VTHPHEIARHYVCGLCNPPARAGKGKPAVQRPLDTDTASAGAMRPAGTGQRLAAASPTYTGH
jgi:hypothetical protein